VCSVREELRDEHKMQVEMRLIVKEADGSWVSFARCQRRRRRWGGIRWVVGEGEGEDEDGTTMLGVKKR